VSDSGTNGWNLSRYWKPSPVVPAPKSKLFWKGTLMSDATGLASFLAS
jgi:hypothetical protein